MGADVRFPHLGIEIEKLGKSISIGGFAIAYYGIIIAFGMVCGYLIAAGRQREQGRIRKCISTLLCGILYLPL